MYFARGTSHLKRLEHFFVDKLEEIVHTVYMKYKQYLQNEQFALRQRMEAGRENENHHCQLIA